MATKNGNGEGSLVRHGDGWRLRWSLENGSRRSKVVGKMTERAAKALLRQIITDAERGLDPYPEPTKKTLLTDFVPEYLAFREHDMARGSWLNLKSIMKAHILPEFGHLAMDQVTQRRVDLWWASYAAHPVQRRNVFFALQKMMKTAKKWNVVPEVLFQIEGAGRDAAKPRPVFEVCDLDAVLSHLDPFYRPAVEVLLAGHMRLGELIALNADDYDRRTGKLRVERQKTKDGLTTETKTRQKKDVILMERGQLALERLPARISGPLFPGKRADRITRLGLRNAWNSARTEAGFPDMHLHDVRHVGLSLVAEVAGIIVAQERAGHASSTSTRRYLHTSARVHEEAVARLDELVRRIS